MIGVMDTSPASFGRYGSSGQAPAARPRVISLCRAYAGLAYLSFLLAALWAVCFLAGVGPLRAIDHAAGDPVWIALPVDAGLLLLFAVQHSVMARAGFKSRLQRWLPGGYERSTFVLASGLLLMLIFWQWKAMPASVWEVRAQPWATVIWVLYAVGWIVAVSATFMVDHLDFLGLRQAGWRAGPRYESPSFSEQWLYRWVRHPMMVGLLIAFWATPSMTAGHLLFAVAGSGYIAVGIRFEEKDLRRELGAVYQEYSDRIPALVPGIKRARGLRGSAGQR